MKAAWMEKPDLCRMLIAAGADVNQKSQEVMGMRCILLTSRKYRKLAFKLVKLTV